MRFGRYSRKRYWLWSLVLLGLLVSMLFPLAVMNDPRGGGSGPILLALIALPLLLLYAKLLIHRLHDLGQPGWWVIPLGLLLVVLPIGMYYESHAVYSRIEQSYAAQQAIQGYVLFMLIGSFALFFGGFIVMGCLPGTDGVNAYGPDPRETRREP